MSESGIVIVSVAPPQSTAGGDFMYRLKQPYEALGSLPGVTTVAVTNVITSREYLLRNADILVIHLLGDRDLIPIIRERRNSGLPTIFEISDNFLNFQPGNPAAAFYEVPENRACILQLVSMADAVQTSTEPLAELFSRFNSNIVTFVNQMVGAGEPRLKEGPVTVGWGGSSGHFEDIKEIAPLIVDWVRSRSDVKFSIMSDERFRALFSALPPSKFTWRPPGTLEKYYEFVQSLDIGLAPIRDDEFNRCRSDVKFMEYASRGVVPVCTGAPTYSRTLRNGETGFLFDSPGEMIEILDRLADDEALRKRIGSAAFEYIKSERSEQKAAERKLKFYKGLLGESGALKRSAISREYLEKSKSLKKSGGSDFYLHEPVEAEKYCYNGMIELYGIGDAGKARKSFKNALREYPEYYAATLYAGIASIENPQDAISLFQKAAMLQPALFEPLFWKFKANKSIGSETAICQTAKELSEKFPYMAEAQLAAAEVESMVDNADAVIRLLESAREANPWNMSASVILAGAYNENGLCDAAEKILKDIVELYPKQELPLLVMGEALMALENFQAAAEIYLRAMKINPQAPGAEDGLLKSVKELYKIRDFTSAMKYINNAACLFPDSTDIRFWAARIAQRSSK